MTSEASVLKSERWRNAEKEAPIWGGSVTVDRRWKCFTIEHPASSYACEESIVHFEVLAFAQAHSRDGRRQAEDGTDADVLAA